MKGITLAFALLLGNTANAQELDFRRIDEICKATSKRPVSDARVQSMVINAYMQNKLLGGQRIDRNGGLVKIGYHEAENEKNKVESVYAWQHIAKYWEAISTNEPSKITVAGLEKQDRTGLFNRLKNVSNGATDFRLSDADLLTIDSSLKRAAIVDLPWSAAFISHLFKQAGFSSREFKFSSGHVDYIDQSFVASQSDQEGVANEHAYRACDIRKTRPRVGDLICYARSDSAKNNSFDSFYGLLLARRSATKDKPIVYSHCDFVVESDKNGDSKLSAIGGNVVQSVTLRRMYLNQQKTLSDNYISSSNSESCEDTEGDCRGNLNRQAWVVLLQYRN